jgi:hypothetical protein
VLNDDHAPAAANNDPGPGPALNNAECTSGGNAIQMGADMGQSFATEYDWATTSPAAAKRVVDASIAALTIIPS